MESEKLELSNLVVSFLIHKESEGLSERTLEWYQQALGPFQDWLAEEGMSTCLDDIGKAEAQGFILYLRTRPGQRGLASSHTVNSRVRALRAFFHWLYEEEITESHRLERVKPPKTKKKIIEILTDEEIDSIFDSINPETVLGARNTAIYSLMLDTGLRLTEVVTLKHQDVHLDTRYVKVLGKGDKERIVAFGITCQKALVKYSERYRFENEEQGGDTFFLCIDGHPMGAEALRSLTERLSKSAGVPRLHPHLMRHTYATRYLLNGGDSLVLQQNLGHTSLEMVRQYVHLASLMMAQISQAFSPLDRFKMDGTRRHRHGFNGEGLQGRIYPNAGKSSRRERGRGK